MPPKSDIQVRELIDDDYPAIAEIYNAVNPDESETAADFRERDKSRDPKCKHRRWVACYDSQVVATGLYTQQIGDYDPKKFVAMVWVHPNHQGKGIGRQLWKHVNSHLDKLHPSIILSWTCEDFAAGIKILTDDGFAERTRSGMSTLDVTAFDLAPYADLESSLRKHRIEIKTLAELATDTDRDRKLYDLEWELIGDIPGLGELSRPDFETFVKESINGKGQRPDGNFVAICADEYVGLSLLRVNNAGDELNQDLTGVKRAYRRKGIALALKVRAVIYARANGIRTIRTTNHIINKPMLAINDRLGFTRSSVWIQFEKRCQPPD